MSFFEGDVTAKEQLHGVAGIGIVTIPSVPPIVSIGGAWFPRKRRVKLKDNRSLFEMFKEYLEMKLHGREEN